MDRTYLPLKEGMLERKRLNSILKEALKAPLASIVAPPGFGKTQTLARLAHRHEGKIVWVHLTSFDNYPDHLWENVIASVRKELPDFADELAKIGFPNDSAKLSMFFRVSSKHVPEKEQLLLFLDDFHNITNTEILVFFEQLLENQFDNVTIIMASNKRNPYAVFKLSDYNFSAVDESAFRFTDDEIQELFLAHDVSSKMIPAEEISELNGWPIALHLLALQMKRGKLDEDNQDSIRAQKDELLGAMFFERYSKNTQQLFVKLSLFFGFSLELAELMGCEDISDFSQTVQDNVFILYDHNLGLFVFTQIYSSFLVEKQQFLSSEEKREIYKVGAEWFLSKNYLIDAVQYFSLCGDYDSVLKTFRCFENKPLTHTLADFYIKHLTALPESFLAKTYDARLLLGSVYANNMELEKAEEIFLQLQTDLEEKHANRTITQDEKHILAELYLMLSDLSFVKNTADFADFAKKACKLFAGHSSKVHGKGLMKMGNNNIFFLDSTEPGAAEHIEALIMDSVPYFRKAQNGVAQAFALQFCTEGAFLTYDIERATETAFRAIYAARAEKQYDVFLNAHFILSKIHLLRGSYEKAMEMMETASAFIEDKNLVDLYDLRDYLKAWLYVRLGDPDSVERWVAEGIEHDAAPMSVGRDYLIRVNYLIATERYYESLAISEQIESYFKRRGLWVSLVYLYLSEATALSRLGQKDRALDCFHEAYQMTWQNNVITPFIECGNVARTLVENAKKSEKYGFDSAWLANISQKSSTYAKYIAAIARQHQSKGRINKNERGIRLTIRELDVLNSMARGLTREEIGDYLGISVNAVKNHIKGIYNKLGAINRADAIYLATVEGLIKSDE